MSSDLPPPTLEAPSFKIIPRIVQFALIGLLGPTRLPLSGFLFLRGLRGLGLLFPLCGGLRWLSSSFSPLGGLLLGAALGLAAPALRLVLRRKRLRKGPLMLCPSRPKRSARQAIAVNVKSISAISTTRSKRPWGQKKKFHIYMFVRAGKESSWARFIDPLGRATAGVRLPTDHAWEPSFSA